jgi:hypothetical protein
MIDNELQRRAAKRRDKYAIFGYVTGAIGTLVGIISAVSQFI